MNQNRAGKAGKIARTAANAAEVTIGGILRTAVKAVATVLLIMLVTALLFTCVFAYYVKTSLSTDLDLSLESFTLELSSTIFYTDPSGGYQELATLEGIIEREWVELERIPKYLQHAAVAIEDQRFYKHKGVDWYRTVGAFANMFLSMRDSFGGSTITQQLIKNLTMEDDVTVQRKLLEIFRALDFEKTYEKDEIMEWYLNKIFFGERRYGVQTASKLYFDKNVWELSLAECASLIGITNNPSRYSPYIDSDYFDSREENKKRQETILYEMYDQGYISYGEYKQAVAETLVFKRAVDEQREITINSYYVDAVIRDVLEDLQNKKGYSEDVAEYLLYSGGLQIYSCMDKTIQDIVDDIYQNRENIPKAGWGAIPEPLQSAIVIIDPYDGGIAALCGGVGEKTVNLGWCLATQARRQPGSSFKPLAVYGPAVDMNLISQTTLVNDASNIRLSGHPTWYPKNSGGYSGIIQIREAVRWSKNTVAAQVLDKLGLQTSYDYLTNKLNIELDPADLAYAPLSLGGLTYGVTVREMAAGFAAFANDGVFTYSRTYSLITDSDGNVVIDNSPETITAFKANTAWNITDMLQRAVSSGTGTEAYLGYMNVAGKTGTTEENKDRYFVGYTPYYVAAVWTGYAVTPATMNFGSSNPAAVIWKKVMDRVHKELALPNKAFPTPTIGPAGNIFGDTIIESPSPSPETEPPESTPPPETTPPPSTTPTDSAPPSTTPTGSVPPSTTPTGSVPPTTSQPPSTTPTDSAPPSTTPTGSVPPPTTSPAPSTPPPSSTPPDPVEPVV